MQGFYLPETLIRDPRSLPARLLPAGMYPRHPSREERGRKLMLEFRG